MQGAILKSFTFENKGGNGAGVILLDKVLSDEEKQNIAAKIGLSETAFLLKKDSDNYDVSFFTPVCEVELCGHATIAAFYYLGLIGEIKGSNEVKTVFQNTKAGRLEIQIMFKNNEVEHVLMQQQEPKIYDTLKGNDLKNIAASLNTDVNNIGLNNCELYPAIVSTGLKDILIPVKSRKMLNMLQVDFNMINDISNEKDVVGYHVFTIENGEIFARNFAPRVGINEECATGTSNGALCSLLFMKNLISHEALVYQGESMNEMSSIYVKLDILDQNNSINVYVGGNALVLKNISIA